MIKNEIDYVSVMAEINILMAKGSSNVSDQELNKIKELAFSAQEYELRNYFVAESGPSEN